MRAYLTASLVLASCAVRPVGDAANEQFRRELVATYAEMTRQLESGSKGLLLDLYCDEAVLYLPGGRDTRGVKALRVLMGGPVDKDRILVCRPVEVDVFGDYAFEVGMLAHRDSNGVVGEETRYMLLWRRENGRWRIYKDIVQGTRSN